MEKIQKYLLESKPTRQPVLDMGSRAKGLDMELESQELKVFSSSLLSSIISSPFSQKIGFPCFSILLVENGNPSLALHHLLALVPKTN